MTIRNQKYRWFVITALCIIQSVATMVLLSPAAIIVEISKTIGTNLGETSAITMVASTIFVIISSYFGGKLIDKVGVNIILVGGSALCVIGSILVLFFGGTYAGLIFIRFIQACGAGPVMASLPLAVTKWSEKKERGIIFGIQGVISSLGAATIMSYVPFVLKKTGNWQEAIFWVALFCILALVLSLIIFFGPKPADKPSTPGYDQINPVSSTLKKVLLLPSAWGALSCIFWFTWIVRILCDLIPSYLAMDQPVGAGIELSKVGALMSGMHIITIVGLLSSGIILEAFFRGRPKKIIMVAFLIPAVSWYLIKFHFVFSNMLILSSLILLGGLALSFVCPMVMTFVSKTYPEQIMGKLGGFLTMSSHLGTLMGLALATYSINIKGAYSITITLIGIGGILGFLSAFFLKEHEINIRGDLAIPPTYPGNP